MDLINEFQKLWIPPDRSFSFGRKTAWKALFVKLCKGLKIIDMIMLSGFIQEGRPPINRRGVRNVALAIYTSIGLRNMLGSFDFGVPLYTISPSARPDPAFCSSLKRTYR